MISGLGRFRAFMQIKTRWIEGLEDIPRTRHLICWPLLHDEKAVSLHGCLVVDHAVFRDTDAVESRTQHAQTTDHDCALDRGDDNSGEVSKHDDVAHDGNGQEQRAKEPAPEAAPKGAALAPKLDPIASIVDADDLFVGVVALADDAEVRPILALIS